MQFYLNGYTPGDPDILAAAPGAETAIGGPSRHRRRPHRRQRSRRARCWRRSSRPSPASARDSSSVATARCRSARPTASPAARSRCSRPSAWAQKLIREAYWVNETVFWRPSPEDRSRIVRTGRVQDTEDGLSEFPHVIVNQARLQQYLLDYMRKSPTRLEPDYGLEFVDPEGRARGRAPGRGHAARRGERRGDDGPRQVRRRLRRRAQPGARFDRRRAARRLRQPRLGRRGHAGRHRLPGHPAQGRDPVGRRGQHPAHPARGRLPGAALRRPRRDRPEQPRSLPRESRRRRSSRPRNACCARTRSTCKSVAWFAVYQVGQRVTDRFDDVPADAGRIPPAARLHRRRRLPHAQREGRPGHERLDAGHVQPRLEARLRARGTRQAGTAAHLLRRAPRDCPGPHRLRQGVVEDHGVAAEGSETTRNSAASIRRSFRRTS